MRETLRYLALGDSYTIGEALPVEGSWPMQWAHALRANGLSVADPGIIAKTGWTTDELNDALNEADSNNTIRPPYDLVSLSIGVNNQYRGRSTENYREEFSMLLKRAILYAGKKPAHVFVLSIPDWGITEFGQKSGRDVAQIAHELDTYNQINREVSKNAGAHWIDISTVTRESGKQAKFYAEDGLHPSRALYALWVKELLKIKL
ncbi:MAG: SGNH/GDSL hydrolase family protein [Arenimonas sp.]